MIPWSLSSASASGGRGAGDAYCTTSISAAPARKTAQVRLRAVEPPERFVLRSVDYDRIDLLESKAPPKYRRAVSRSATDAVT